MSDPLPTHHEQTWLTTDHDLDRLQWTTILYDLHEINTDNGLVRDKTDPAAPSSIAASGLALANLPIMAERGILYRPFAAKHARRTLRYIARGASFGPDDGTVAPWVVVASLPFAPEIVLRTVHHLDCQTLGGKNRRYGFKASFNQTFRVDDSPTGWWVTPYQFDIDQGPVVLMIENYRTGLIWNLMRRCAPMVTGLRRAGFTGGWL